MTNGPEGSTGEATWPDNNISLSYRKVVQIETIWARHEKTTCFKNTVLSSIIRFVPGGMEDNVRCALVGSASIYPLLPDHLCCLFFVISNKTLTSLITNSHKTYPFVDLQNDWVPKQLVSSFVSHQDWALACNGSWNQPKEDTKISPKYDML